MNNLKQRFGFFPGREETDLLHKYWDIIPLREVKMQQQRMTLGFGQLTQPSVEPKNENETNKSILWLYSIHSKSEHVCGFYFSVSKNLRKKCVNSDGKISRQKCVNHKTHKNLVSMWHFFENIVCFNVFYWQFIAVTQQ